MDTMKTIMRDGEWIQVPAELTRLADKWVEVVDGVATAARLGRRSRLPMQRLNVACFTPDDQQAVRITAPWWSE